ncbi:MAG: lysophospholipid acyltransferase family protein [Dermatophilaceae bacterium]
MFYWLLKKVLLGPLLKLLFRPWVEGEDNLPAHGAAVLASNHLSFSDSFFLPIVAKRRITFPAKMEYFTGPGIKGRLTKWFFKGIGQIPIDRSGGQASEAAIQSGLRVLRRGQLFGIYPEGTRSPDGRLYKGKTGMARMALEAGCPIIPVAMIGTDKAQPTGQKVPNIMRIGIRIGRPLDFSRYEGMHNDRFVLRSITDEVMYELMLLSGQEYVDVYATSLKKNVLQSAIDRAREIQGGVRRSSDSGDAAGGSDEPPSPLAPEGESTGGGQPDLAQVGDVERRAS